MPELTIQKLTSSDLNLLLPLRMEVLSTVFAAEREHMSEQEWQELAEENRRYYRHELSSGGHIACIARLGDDVVGCGGVCFHRELPSPDNRSGTCAFLMNIYTRPDFQGRGVARAVCAWLIERAREAGAEKIYLESSEAARRLYRSLGFDDLDGYMRLRPTGPA